MDRFAAAVAWSGTDVTLSMFVVSPEAALPALDLPEVRSAPERIRTYELEDEEGVLHGRHVHEYDLVWDALPGDVEEIVTASLRSALAQGAVVAWFAFEGSFDFRFLLHPDVASQVYAVAADHGVHLALDDDRRSSGEWRALLAEHRRRVL